jgi:hypothetical protein
MASGDKVYEAVEKLARTTRDSYETVIDHTVALGEENVKFMRGVFDTSVREYRQQAEANWAMTQELVERAEKQRDAFRTVIEESMGAYWGALYAPLSYHEGGMREVASVGNTDGRLPISNYDELTVDEISKKLDGLSVEEIEKVRAYEKRHKNRETLLEQIDRKMKAAS